MTVYTKSDQVVVPIIGYQFDPASPSLAQSRLRTTAAH